MTPEERAAGRAAAQKRWREKNRDKALTAARAWREANTQHVAEYNRTYRESNPETCLVAQRAWREENPDLASAGRRSWRTRNPEAMKVQRHRRRARQHAGGDLTTAEWLDVLEEFDHRCAYCQAQGELHMEHMTPLSRGGRHTKSNVVPACPSCNLSKGTKTIFEFLAVN